MPEARRRPASDDSFWLGGGGVQSVPEGNSGTRPRPDRRSGRAACQAALVADLVKTADQLNGSLGPGAKANPTASA